MNSTMSCLSPADAMRGGALTGADRLASATPAEADADYGDPRLGWLLILLIATAVALGLAYVAIYVGVEYGRPSWGAHAYPPPLIR